MEEINIILDNKLYNITTYINEHPGGTEVFINNEDLTEKFNEVGHSKYAINLLKNYYVKDLDNKTTTTIKYKENKLLKLITHEDKFNIHKIAGVICLLNFGYLLFDFCYTGLIGRISIRTNTDIVIFSWIHAILSLSSLQFIIPKNRTGILPMIWQEFRMHNIIFALRSIINLNIVYFFGYNIYTQIFRSGIILLTLYLADLSTEYLRDNPLESTTATMPYWTDINPELQKKIKLFYTHAQIMATIVCLNNKIDLMMFVVLPIQIASFLMTLCRKNIVSSYIVHLIYGGSLLSGYIIMMLNINLYIGLLLGTIIMYLRIYMNYNKYFLWLVLDIISLYKYQNNILLFLMLPIIYIIFNNYGILKDKRELNESNNIVIQNNEIIKNHHEIKIKLTNKINNFYYGQYYNLFYNLEKRPYTPININDNELTFLIKKYPNGISEKICNTYKLNSTIYIKGPFGTKYYDKINDNLIINNNIITEKNILMFCCGTGITPFYNILDNIDVTKYNFILNCSFRSKEDIFLINETKNLFLSKENNKLDENKIREILNKYDDYIVLICGSKSYNKLLIDTINNKVKYYEW